MGSSHQSRPNLCHTPRRNRVAGIGDSNAVWLRGRCSRAKLRPVDAHCDRWATCSKLVGTSVELDKCSSRCDVADRDTVSFR